MESPSTNNSGLSSEVLPGSALRSRSRKKKAPPTLPTNTDKLFFSREFTRPLPVKDDLVVYQKGSQINLAVVHKIDTKPMERLVNTSGCTIRLENIPSCKRTTRLLEEVIVLDRTFTNGETVTEFVNKFDDGPHRRECWPKEDMMLGVVTDIKIRGDVLVLPPFKNLVVTDIPLDKSCEYIEMVNFNIPHNYIMYDQWIGDAKSCTNEVTLLFRDKYRLVVRESSSNGDGVYLIRRDPSDATKALVPGEIVQMSMADALGKFAVWEKQPPIFLKRKYRRGGALSVGETRTFVVEKNETIALHVDWMTSPSDPMNPPPSTIERENIHKVARIELTPHTHLGTCDRLTIPTPENATVMTKKEYFKQLTEQFKSKFCPASQFSAWGECTKVEDDPHTDTTASSSKLAKKSRISESEPQETATVERLADIKEVPEEAMETESLASTPGCQEESHGSDCDPATDSDAPDSDFLSCSSSTLVNTAASGSGGAAIASSTSAAAAAAITTPLLTPAVPLALPGASRKKQLTRKRTNLSRLRRKIPDMLKSNRNAKELLGDSFIGEVLSTRTFIDVVWMDGRVEKNIPSYRLQPTDPDLDQQDHLPGLIVMRKGSSNGKEDLEMGMMLDTDVADRACHVRWFSREDVNKPFGEGVDEEMTLFDIMQHPGYNRSYLGNYGINFDKGTTELRKCAYQLINDLPNGKQTVRYLDGETAELWPHEITPLHFMDDRDDDHSDDSEDEYSDNEDHHHHHHDHDDHLGSETTSQAQTTSPQNTLTFSFPRAPTPIPMDVDSHPNVNISVDMDEQEFVNRLSSKHPVEMPLVVRIVTAREEDNPTAPVMSEGYIIYHTVMQILACDSWPQLTLRLYPGMQPHRDAIPAQFAGILAATGKADVVSGYLDKRQGTLDSGLSSPIPFDQVSKTKHEQIEAMCDRLHAVHAVFPFNTIISAVQEVISSADEKSYSDRIITVERAQRCHGDVVTAAGGYSEALASQIGAEMRRLMIEEGFFIPKLPNLDSMVEVHSTDNEPAVMRSSSPCFLDLIERKGSFQVLPAVPKSHEFRGRPIVQPDKSFLISVAKEHRILSDNMPLDTHVVAYDDRMDLLSVLIMGPADTPFEGVPFYFDIYLPSNYPKQSPEVFFVAFSQEQLNPNLYQAGKVCTSLLGTWSGEGVETWQPTKSNLLQLILSIQGLILVAEPYFNEAGYESRKNLPEMQAHSKRYNETATVNALEYLWRIGYHPPTNFEPIIRKHVLRIWPDLVTKLRSWVSGVDRPAFPTGFSKGFVMAVDKAITRLEAMYTQMLKNEGKSICDAELASRKEEKSETGGPQTSNADTDASPASSLEEIEKIQITFGVSEHVNETGSCDPIAGAGTESTSLVNTVTEASSPLSAVAALRLAHRFAGVGPSSSTLWNDTKAEILAIFEKHTPHIVTHNSDGDPSLRLSHFKFFLARPNQAAD